MAHLMDLSEEQFRVLSNAEQTTIAKNAVTAALDLDDKLVRVFEDAIRQYHRALQYISHVEEEDDTLAKQASTYFKRQRYLKAQLEEFKKEERPERLFEGPNYGQKAEALAYAVKGNVLTLDETYKITEKVDTLKSQVVSQTGWLMNQAGNLFGRTNSGNALGSSNSSSPDATETAQTTGNGDAAGGSPETKSASSGDAAAGVPGGPAPLPADGTSSEIGTSVRPGSRTSQGKNADAAAGSVASGDAAGGTAEQTRQSPTGNSNLEDVDLG